MCEFCNGNKDMQEPLTGRDEDITTFPILTVIGDEQLLSVIDVKSAKEFLYPILFCPKCGRSLNGH